MCKMSSKKLIISKQNKALTPRTTSASSTTQSVQKRARTPTYLKTTTSNSQESLSDLKNTKQSALNATLLSATNIDCYNDEGCEDAYNNYLLALIKKHTVSQHLMKVKQELGDQLAVQSELLYKDKLELQRLEMENEIETQSRKIVVKITNLQKVLEEFQALCEKSNIERFLNIVIEKLNEVKDRVVLENVICGDNDKIVEQLNVVSRALQKFLQKDENHDKLNDLAENLQTTLCLKKEFINKDKQLKEMLTELGVLLLKTLSDYFDLQRNVA